MLRPIPYNLVAPHFAGAPLYERADQSTQAKGQYPNQVKAILRISLIVLFMAATLWAARALSFRLS